MKLELKDLIKKVEKHFNCDIKTKNRCRSVVMARASYYYFARCFSSYSLDDIAKEVNRHHSAVIHSLNNFKDWIDQDAYFKADFEVLKSIILSAENVNKFTAETLVYKYNKLLMENDMLKNEIKLLKKAKK